MINHLHFVCTGETDESDLIAYMRRFKQVTEYNARGDGIEKLWQRSYSDTVLWDGDDMSEVVFYVLDNPVRAGIIAENGEYPYSRLLIEEF